jgi:hypothetical protein
MRDRSKLPLAALRDEVAHDAVKRCLSFEADAGAVGELAGGGNTWEALRVVGTVGCSCASVLETNALNPSTTNKIRIIMTENFCGNIASIMTLEGVLQAGSPVSAKDGCILYSTPESNRTQR